MSEIKGKGNADLGCIIIMMYLIFLVLVGGICWPYTINTWLAFFGKTQTIVWWQGVLLGLIPFLGQISIPAAVTTWILMLFLA